MELKALKKDEKKSKAKKPSSLIAEKKKPTTKNRPSASRFIASNLNISTKKDEQTKKESPITMIETESKFESASSTRRAISLIADYVLITLFLAPILYLQLVDSTLLVQPEQTIMYSALLSLVGIAYASTFLILYQQTFGMMIAKIHVPQYETAKEKIGVIKYSLLYSGFFVLWIITIVNPVLTLLAWSIIFAELISYRLLNGRTMFELFGNIELLQDRRK